jgi:nitroreductase
MDVDHLLTATRSARTTLDLDAPIDLAVVRECLGIGLQAANGSNQQSWRWLVVTEPERRAELARLYREGYEATAGGAPGSHGVPADTPVGRVLASADWLADHLAEVPLFVIPCYEPYLRRVDPDGSFARATVYGSIFPAGRLRAGHVFKPALRRSVDEVVAVDRWDGPPL